MTTLASIFRDNITGAEVLRSVVLFIIMVTPSIVMTRLIIRNDRAMKKYKEWS